MGRECSTNGVKRIKPQIEGDHWEDQDVGGWMISKWNLER
jgi:hypothetical protein